MIGQTLAVARDQCWLQALAKLSDSHPVATHRCDTLDLDCLAQLPAAEPETLLLLDGDACHDPAATVTALHQLGWQTIIVVSAENSGVEAYALLRGGSAYDYWPKSYKTDVVRNQLIRCWSEIKQKQPL
jgi:hypothetical protein